MKMAVREIGCKSVHWLQLAQDRVQCQCEYVDEPSGSINAADFFTK
jgi:hypothetical protein